MRHLVVAVIGVLAIAACNEDRLALPRTSKPQELRAAGIDSGYIMRNGTPLLVVFEIKGGRAIFEGDIDLGPAEWIARSVEELLARTSQPGPERGVAIDGKRWGMGLVPYIIEPGFPDTQRVVDAVNHIRARVAGLNIRPRTTHADYIVFRRSTDPNSCGSSLIGRQGGAQSVFIGDGCSMGVVVHEVGHALGFYHEQSRCDRDSYVEILTSNIQSGYESQFTKQCLLATDYEAYDEGSIMHYRKNAFGKVVNNQALQTIRSLRGLDNLMGQRDSLGTNDIFSINRVYRPYSPYPVSVTNAGGVALVSWPPSNRATFGVWLLRHYEEWNDYTGELVSSFDDYLYGFTTTETSIQDPNQSWTGNTTCYVYQNINGSAYYTYYYEVGSSYTNGVTSPAERSPAPVAAAWAPCWPDPW